MDTCPVCGKDYCRTPGVAIQNFCRVAGTAVPDPIQRKVYIDTGRPEPVVQKAESEFEFIGEQEPELVELPKPQVIRPKPQKRGKRR